MKRFLSVLLVCLLLVPALEARGEEAVSVTVYGYGEARLTLDTAVILLEITSSAKTVAEARALQDALTEQLYAVTEQCGLSSDQLQLSDFSVGAQYDFQYGKLERGVEQNIQTIRSEWKLTLPDKEELEDVLDAILSAKLVSGYSFTLESSDAQEAYQEALELAVQDARRKAEAVAKGNGATLGRLCSIREEEPADPRAVSSDDAPTDRAFLTAAVETTWLLTPASTER